MKLALFFLSLALIATCIGLGLYLQYLQWFVHPEYTTPMMFWAYWQVSVSAATSGLLGAGAIMLALEER